MKKFAKKGTKKRPTAARRTATSTKMVKSIVKREIARQAEDKEFEFADLSQVIYPSSSAGFVNSTFAVSPYTGALAIAQGTGQGQRIGNKIKIKKISLKGTIWPEPYNVTTNPNPQPVYVIFWLFYDKEAPVNVPSIGSQFLQFGNSAIGLQNQIIDTFAPINTDKYRLLTKRVFKVGNSGFTGTGTNPVYQSFANNDFKLNNNFSIDLKKYCVENVTYNDTGTTPTTRGLYWAFTCVAANGGAIPAAQVPAQMAYQLHMTYEDL